MSLNSIKKKICMVQINYFFFLEIKANGREGRNVKIFESLSALSIPSAALHSALSIQMNYIR